MSKPKYTGVERRCQHTGSSCIHRSYPPQAFRSGPESVTAREIVGLVLFILFAYGAIIYALPIVLSGLAGHP